MSPDYATDVAAVLSATATDPGLVTLEVTESVFVQNSDRALVVLDDLKEPGSGSRSTWATTRRATPSCSPSSSWRTCSARRSWPV
jgi:hypothetical protein